MAHIFGLMLRSPEQHYTVSTGVEVQDWDLGTLRFRGFGLRL